MSILKYIFLGVLIVLVIAALLFIVILIGSLAYETLLSTIEYVKEYKEKHKRRSE